MSKTTGLGALPLLLERYEGVPAVQRVFGAEGVPLSVLGNKEIRIPTVSLMGLFDRAARAVGDRTFGLRVGELMQPTDFGPWSQYCAAAQTLGGALRRSVRTVHYQQSGGALTLEVEGTQAIWRYYAPRVSDNAHQHSDHVLSPMIRFVSQFAGADWRPSWIEVNYPRDVLAREIELRIEAPVRFGCGGVGVAFDAALLNRSRAVEPNRAARRPMTLVELEAGELAAGRPEPVRSILSIVSLRLLDGQADIEGAARVAGLGVQALQRMLRQQGASYRQVLDTARAARAKALLRETDHSVTEIALDLGYTDHANFTRAFSRWEGCPPNDFRRHVAAFDPGRLAEAGAR